jgi:hypothetical protein
MQTYSDWKCVWIVTREERTMDINKNDTAVVFIDPQNEVLSEQGIHRYGTMQLKKLSFLTITIIYLMQVELIAMPPTFDYSSILFYKIWRILA